MNLVTSRTAWTVAALLALTACVASPTGQTVSPAATDSQTATGPASSVRPVDRQAVRQPGQVVTTYNAETDHTQAAFLAPVATVPDLYLYAYGLFAGREPASGDSEVFLGVVSFAGGQSFGTSRPLSISVDGVAVECLGVWSTERTDDGRRLESLLCNRTFDTPSLQRMIAGASVRIEVRGMTTFEVTPEHKAFVRELLRRLIT
jgi:hypothetical protein